MYIKMIPHCGECHTEIPNITYKHVTVGCLSVPQILFEPLVCPNCKAKLEGIVSDAIIDKGEDYKND